MSRKAWIIASLVILPRLGFAATYACTVEQRSSEGKGWQQILSSKIVLKDDVATDAEVLIIEKNGKHVSLFSLKLDADDKASRAQLRRYDGRLVLGLRKDGKRLDINLGHVDPSSKANAVPMDVISWAPLGTKELGVVDLRKNLQAFCRLE